MRPFVVLLVAIACALAVGRSVVPAEGDVFGPISLVSISRTQQADLARDPAISADGRYVAFDGSFGGALGVWRRDVQTGEVQPVAVEDAGNAPLSAPDAELPSISQDGRYVSFTTTAALDPEHDTNADPDVYVRDMNVPTYGCGGEAPVPGCDGSMGASGPAPSGAFALASAADGSPAGLSYQTSSPGRYGSQASGRFALSADGRRVAFVTTAISDLVPARAPAAPETPETPALQVAVRNLETRRTELVSVEYDPTTGRPAVDEATGLDKPVPAVELGGQTYGAVYPGTPGVPSFPFLSELRSESAPFPRSAVGASLSADGSTVTWMGQEVAKQAASLSHDFAQSASYIEPLWRRIADGLQAPTRRVTGGTDPGAPGCAASGETQVSQVGSLADPCQGPFAITGSEGLPRGPWRREPGTADYLPRLSADGRKVAFLANAQYLPGGEAFASVEESTDDLYLADMSEGLSRLQALRRLTEVAGGVANEPARAAPIVDLGISADGTRIAFSTQRTVFPLGSPTYVSAPSGAPGMAEMFVVDLTDDTLTRVTHGFHGESEAAEQPHVEVATGEDPYKKPQEGSFSPSFSADGNTLAFSSSADNLAFGDGNGASDVFVVQRTVFGSTPTETYVSSPPPHPSLRPAWALGVTAVSQRNGSVLLYVQVPGAGLLSASATSPVRIRARRRARGHSTPRTRSTVAVRRIASAKRTTGASGGELVILSLVPARTYRPLAAQRGGLSATVTLGFAAAGHPQLQQLLGVTFAGKPRKKHAAPTRGSRRGGAR